MGASAPRSFSGVLSDHNVLSEGRGWLSDAHPLMAAVVGGISHAGMGWLWVEFHMLGWAGSSDGFLLELSEG